jgi:HSP20 family protein
MKLGSYFNQKKGGNMTHIKKSYWPSFAGGPMLSDFFDKDSFFDLDLLRKQSVPAVNITETKNGFDIDIAAPGLSKKDFQVMVDNRVLTISSEKEEEKEEEQLNFTRREFSYRTFTRSFVLPENVLENNLKANYSDGILHLSIPKRALSHSKLHKAIEVK